MNNTDPNLQYLQRLSGKPVAELKALQSDLEISYSQMVEFYKALGFFPSPGIIPAINEFGVNQVVNVVRVLRKPNPINYDFTGDRNGRTGHRVCSDGRTDHEGL